MANRPDIGDVFIHENSDFERVGLYVIGSTLSVGILGIADGETYIRHPFGSFDSKYPHKVIRTMTVEEMKTAAQYGMVVSGSVEDYSEQTIQRIIDQIGTTTNP